VAANSVVVFDALGAAHVDGGEGEERRVGREEQDRPTEPARHDRGGGEQRGKGDQE
jgi:hypothetical protein